MKKNKTIPSSKITFRCLNNQNMNEKITKFLENNIGFYNHKFKESIYYVIQKPTINPKENINLSILKLRKS